MFLVEIFGIRRQGPRALVDLARLPANATIERHAELLRVQVMAGLGRRRGEFLIEELVQLARRAGDADLNHVEPTAHWLLSVVAEESGDFDAAQEHSLGAERAGRAADPETRLHALANTARCLVQLERETDRASPLLEEALELAASLPQLVLDIPWGLGLLRALEGREAEARAALEEGAAMARDQKNHWALFECLSRQSMLDLAAGDIEAIEKRDSLLRELADKLGEGSERALASSILVLARRRAGSDPAELEDALRDLRGADSKGLLAWALNEAARLDLGEGDTERARERALEALTAASEVHRHHQWERARHLLIEVGPPAMSNDSIYEGVRDEDLRRRT